MSSSSGSIETGWKKIPILGIIGGGQLARMLCQAASKIGVSTRVIEKTEECPASHAASELVVGDWSKSDVLIDFSAGCDVVTLESEFVEADVLKLAEEAGTTILPNSSTVRVVQDKFFQKSRLVENGVAVADFRAVSSEKELEEAGKEFGWPLVLKTRKLGYDGKGNTTVKSADDIERAWKTLGGGKVDLFCEKFIPFARELAVIVCTDLEGYCITYPLVETFQKDHICHEVLCPAEATDEHAATAIELAVSSVEAVGGIGTFGVELFETQSGEVIVNELAPRVHNSGHYTIEACYCSQFENHVRAVLNLPLGSSDLILPQSVMVNILGEKDGDGWPGGLHSTSGDRSVNIHWYGKTESRVGRKMGHVTTIGHSKEVCLLSARNVVKEIYNSAN